MNNLTLKVYDDSDKDFVERLFLDEKISVDFIHSNTFTSLNSFEHWFLDRLQYSFRDFYIIKNQGKSIGMVYSYNYDEISQHVMVTVAISPKYCGIGIGAIVMIAYLDKIFRENSMHKVFAEIYSFNTESLKSTLKFGFVEEGVLKDYKLINGEYYNLHLLSLTREQYSNIVKEYEKLFKIYNPTFE